MMLIVGQNADCQARRRVIPSNFPHRRRVVVGKGIMRSGKPVTGRKSLVSLAQPGSRSLPDMTAFVDIHDALRKGADGDRVLVKYEVWCPGHSLSKVFFEQCQIAARTLVEAHNVSFAPSTQDEFKMFPGEISVYLQNFMRDLIAPLLAQYGLD